MAYENLPFVEAAKKLASRSGIIIQEEVYDAASEKRRRSRSKLLEINNQAGHYMHEQLMRSPAAEHARAYLKSRGYGHEMAKRWLIGWMPANQNQFFSWAKEKNFTGRQLADCGIARLRDNDRPAAGIYIQLKDRLMFPIYNDYGDIIAYSGRQLDSNPNTGKYVNSPETALFKKSKTFYGLDKARRHMAKSFALLCEGQIDVIACHESGLESAVATLGTACTAEHARILKRYTKDVVICFDSDNAGLAAADKAFKFLAAEGMHIRMVIMPQGDDPDTFIKRDGAEAFAAIIDQAKEYFVVKLDHETSTRDLTTIRERTVLATELATLVTYVGDKMTQEALIGQISTRLGIGTEELRGQVVEAEKAKSRSEFFETRRAKKDARAEQKTAITPTKLSAPVASLCYLALSSKDAQQWLCEQIESLIDPLNSLAGGGILKRILNKLPNTESSAAVQAYITTLREEDQLALRDILNEAPGQDPVQQAEEATTTLISTHFQTRDATIRAKLANPSLSHEEMNALMNEATEVHQILKGLSNRSIR